jgi:hypothetical protein
MRVVQQTDTNENSRVIVCYQSDDSIQDKLICMILEEWWWAIASFSSGLDHNTTPTWLFEYGSFLCWSISGSGIDWLLSDVQCSVAEYTAERLDLHCDSEKSSQNVIYLSRKLSFFSPSSNHSKSLDLKLLTFRLSSMQSRPKVGLSSEAFLLLLLVFAVYFSISIKPRTCFTQPNETAISIR